MTPETGEVVGAVHVRTIEVAVIVPEASDVGAAVMVLA